MSKRAFFRGHGVSLILFVDFVTKGGQFVDHSCY